MKRVLATILALCMLFSALPVTASAETAAIASGTCGDNLTWTLNSEGVLTISGTGDMATYGIGSGPPWATYKDQIVSVNIEDGVTSIGAYAFWNYANITSVTIPEGITTIGIRAFDGCEKLASVTIPASVTNLGGNAFYQCSSLSGIFVDADNRKYSSDDRGVLFNKDKQQLLSAPGGISGDYVFPSSVTSISDSAFFGCDHLESVTISGGVTYLSAAAFRECEKLSSVNILEGVEWIEWCAFFGCPSLKTVNIPNTVTKIDSGAFSNCNSLESVFLPDSVTNLYSGAFSNCASLKEVLVSDDNTLFSNDDQGILYNKTKTDIEVVPGGLQNVTIPESVTTIGYESFTGCSSLAQIVIPGNVTKISNGAFNDCWNLSEITFEGDAPTFGEHAYETNPDIFLEVTATAYYPAGNRTWTADKRQNFGGTLTWVPQGDVSTISSGESKKLTLEPNSFTDLLFMPMISGNYAFYMPIGAFNYIPENDTGYHEDFALSIWHQDVCVASYRYYGDYKVALVHLEAGETYTLRASHEWECDAEITGIVHLDKLEEPESISIETDKWVVGSGDYLWLNCVPDTKLPFLAGEITWEVADESILKLSYCWNAQAQLDALAEGTTTVTATLENGLSASCEITVVSDACGEGLKWSLSDDGYLNIFGEGAMDDYENSESTPWFEFASEITYIDVGREVTSIGDYAFSGLTNATGVYLNRSLTHIGDFAFQNCNSLTTVSIPSTVQTMGEGVFKNCAKLKTVTFSAAELPAGLFEQCESLNNVTLADTVTKIGDHAFKGCSALDSITIPASVTEIGEGAFMSSGLKQVNFKGNAPAIGKNAFASVTAKMIYPADDATWTAAVMQNYGGSLTWKGFNGIVVWVEENLVAWVRSRVATYLEENPDLNLEILVEIAPDSYELMTNIENAADVFTYVSDSLRNLNSFDALIPMSGETVAQASGQICDTLMSNVTAPNGQVYGVPYRANTWFMYYNKNIFSEEDVKSLETMLEKGVVSFPVTNSWNLPAFYFAAGGSMFGPQGNDASARVRFGGENGTAATKYLVNLINHENFVHDTNGEGNYGLKNGSIGAYFSGSWDYPNLQAALGDDLGAVELPTVRINGENKQLRAFCGAYAYGINANTKHPEIAEDLIRFLTSAESQKLCYQNTSTVPSVTALAEDPVIAANPMAVAQIRTAAYTAVPQPWISEMDITWMGSVLLGRDLIAGVVTLENAAERTREYNDSLNGFVTIAYGSCGDNLTWELTDSGILTISGTGAMYDYAAAADPAAVSAMSAQGQAPWYASKSDICQIIIGEDVTSIGSYAFVGCDAVETVTIPAGIEKIGQSAFADCTGLTQIVFEGDAPEIGESAFAAVEAEVTYPEDNDTWNEEVIGNYGGELTWPEVEEEEEYFTQWISATTSLNGTIDLNIYVALSDNILNDPNAYVRFIRNGEIVDVPVSEGIEAEKRGQICYRYSCEIFAKQVADTVTIQVMNSKGAINNTLEYSVMRYCVNQIKNSKDAELVKLCKALLNYATAAQVYFTHNTGNLANASLSEADKVLPSVDASAYKFNVVGSETGIKPRSATLMLEAEVAIRVYFIVEEGYDISDFTFTIDGVEVPVQQNEKGYYIESEGIAAKELDNMHKFTVGGLTVNYGALSYVNSKAGGSNVNEANLAKALYAYYTAAEALLG